MQKKHEQFQSRGWIHVRPRPPDVREHANDTRIWARTRPDSALKEASRLGASTHAARAWRAREYAARTEYVLHREVEALLTDLAIDEAGNLWLPGGAGALYRSDASELTKPEPALKALPGSAIGSVERLAINTVAGPTFIQ